MTPPNNAALEPFVEHALQASDIKNELHRVANECSSEGPHFPFKEWQILASHNLLHRFAPRLCTPSTPTPDLPCKDIALTGYWMTRHHQSLGLTMTWVGQLLKVHFLRTLGCDDPAYIEAILDGDSLSALAISEPGVGAHPKHLSCRALKSGDSYIINGEKAFVSHGPYADRFIVLAITEHTQGRKYFSAFLVPADSTGLQRLPPQLVKGLQPSSHCNIVFTDCQIPAAVLIGTAGQAFAEISLPMRTLEDSLMLAPIAGAMQAQLDYLAQPDASHNESFDLQIMGELLSLTESAKELGIIAASKLDQHDDIPDLTPLIIGFRSLVQQVQTALFEFHDEYPGLRELAADIQTLSNIGRQASAARTASLADRFFAEQRKKD